MKIKYHIDLGNYITKDNFNSAYNKEIMLNDNMKIVSTKIGLSGYFPYKLFDAEDEIRVKKQYEEKLREVMDEMICIINSQVVNAIDILCKNKNIESINLHPYKKGEFTIYTSIVNSK